jgi:hypothetical protein
MSGSRKPTGKAKTSAVRPLRSESHFARERAKAPTSQRLAEVEWNALRARMTRAQASDQAWDALADQLARMHRAG